MPQLEILCDLWHPETNPDGYFTVDSHSLTCGDGFSGSHRLRNTLARFINRNFHTHEPVTKKELIVTSGADLGFRAQAKVVQVSFGDVDPLSLETVDIYEKALMDAQSQGIRVRAFLLCNPHNPLGRCYTREVLEAYMRFCEKHGLHLISDEVYALSVWKNPEVPHHQERGFYECIFVKTNRLRLAENYLTTTRFLKDHQIPYKKGSNAGLFVWADLFQPKRSEIDAILQKEAASGKTTDQVLWGLEEKLQETLLAHKIFLARGADFGGDVPGWFRIVFAHEKAYLLLGLGRIVEAVEAFRQT
ncbi:hypothetical protein HG530_007092 [Fusarium avenaceum]|nr:hypothetical protein HG530_007092 [Fusarium avenaceum]